MIKPANILWLLLPLCFFTCTAWGQMKTESFEFVHEGRKLNGLLDMPTEQPPVSLIVMIQVPERVM